MGEHLILFDGVCGLCNRLIQFVLKRDPQGVFRFAWIQGDVGRSFSGAHGKAPDNLETVHVIAGFRSQSPVLLSKSGAALFVLKTLGGPWRLAGILGILPDRLLDWLYDVVARNRYTVFGRYESCLLPSPQYSSRFIDAAPTTPSGRTAPPPLSQTGQTGDRDKSPQKRSR